jgi:hypothetical protein
MDRRVRPKGLGSSPFFMKLQLEKVGVFFVYTWSPLGFLLLSSNLRDLTDENQSCYFWCHSDEGGITYLEQLMRFLLRRNDKEYFYTLMTSLRDLTQVYWDWIT